MLPHTHTCIQNSDTHLIPGPRFPLGRAGYSVTRPAALRTLTRAVLAVYGAVGAVMERLQAAYGAKLIAGTPTGFGAMFPLFRYPAVGVGIKIPQSLGCRACKPSLFCSLSDVPPSGAHCNSGRISERWMHHTIKEC